MLCNTDPMQSEGHAGNGLHFHFAPVQDAQTLDIRNADGTLTDPARWLIGGLAQMGTALMAFGNRVRGSFARLTQAKEAPSAITWGEFDRLALIRLPVVARDVGGKAITPPTIEFRLPDGSALPHLLLAGAALAMVRGRDTEQLDELLEKTSSTRVTDESVDVEPLPLSFPEVADVLERHRGDLEVAGTFPPGLVDNLLMHLREQFRANP
jgi:glutamine synthetase